MSYPENDYSALASRNGGSKILAFAAALAAGTTASVAPAGAATITCSTVAACVLAINASTTSKGPAITGSSSSGDGVQGKTSFAGGTSPATAKSGVSGFDLTATGAYNSGVFGYSAIGSGVHASTRNGNGVLAVASGPFGTGINVVSQHMGLQDAINGVNYPLGAYIVSSSSDSSDVGLVADASQSGSAIAAYGLADGVDGVSQGNGAGVFGEAFGGGAGVEAVSSGLSTSIALLAIGGSDFTPVIEAQDSISTNLLTLDNKGNLEVLGHVTAGSAAMFATRRADGRVAMAYGSRETAATIEDVGEAQLTSGSAAIPLAADFAQIIDLSRPYHVFITPEGENHGLYVSQKTARGFVVRESGGGRSTMALEYRIVATPRGESASRLPGEESLARALTRRHIMTA